MVRKSKTLLTLMTFTSVLYFLHFYLSSYTMAYELDKLPRFELDPAQDLLLDRFNSLMAQKNLEIPTQEEVRPSGGRQQHAMTQRLADYYGAQETSIVEPIVLLDDDFNKCQFWIDNNWFDLSDLQEMATYMKGYERGDTSKGIDFTWCRSLNNTGATCEGNYYAGLFSHDSETQESNCTKPLSGVTNVPDKSIAVMGIPNNNGGYEGIDLYYTGSPDGTSLVINLYCSTVPFYWDFQFSEHTAATGIKYYQMTMLSKNGCAVIKTESYWFYLKKLKYLFAVIGIAGGALSCIAGRMLMKYIMFAVVLLSTIVVSNFTLYMASGGVSSSSTFYWITLVISTIVGLGIAWASSKFKIAGAFIFGAWTGFEIGAATSNLLYFSVQSLWFFWMIIIAFALAFAFLTASNYNFHMIWVTAIFGSYLFLISFSLFMGRWPVDLNLPDLNDVGAVTKREPKFFLYMGMWICMTACGIIFQCMVLYYYKRTGKMVNPKFQEAIDNFHFGRTQQQRERDKKRRQFAKYVENEMDRDSERHDSLFIDLQSKQRSVSQSEDSYRAGSMGRAEALLLLGKSPVNACSKSGGRISKRHSNSFSPVGSRNEVSLIEEATMAAEDEEDSPLRKRRVQHGLSKTAFEARDPNGEDCQIHLLSIEEEVQQLDGSILHQHLKVSYEQPDKSGSSSNRSRGSKENSSGSRLRVNTASSVTTHSVSEIKVSGAEHKQADIQFSHSELYRPPQESIPEANTSSAEYRNSSETTARNLPHASSGTQSSAVQSTIQNESHSDKDRSQGSSSDKTAEFRCDG